MKRVVVQVIVRRFRVGKLLRVERENAEPVHVIDVHPDHVAGDLLRAERVGHLAHARIGIIRIAALVEPHRPRGRHGHLARQFRQPAHDGLRRIAVDDDDPERRAHALKGDAVVIGLEFSLPGGVEDDAERGAVGPYAQHPRMRLVEPFALELLVGEIIGVPEGDFLAVAQQRASHLAGAVQARARRDRERRARLAVFQKKFRHQMPVRRHRAEFLRRRHEREGRGTHRLVTRRHEQRDAVADAGLAFDGARLAFRADGGDITDGEQGEQQEGGEGIPRDRAGETHGAKIPGPRGLETTGMRWTVDTVYSRQPSNDHKSWFSNGLIGASIGTSTTVERAACALRNSSAWVCHP